MVRIVLSVSTDKYGAGGEISGVDKALRSPRFAQSVLDGDCDSAKEYLTQNPEGSREGPVSVAMALSAAASLGDVNMVKLLVEFMAEEDMEIKDENGVAALPVAVIRGNAQVAKYIVDKNKKVVSIPCNALKDAIPLVLASSLGHLELTRYLYHVTPLDALLQDNGRQGSELFFHALASKELDIALDLIRRCPNLALERNYDGIPPLHTLSAMPSLFKSETPLSFWKKWIYESIHIPPADSSIRDICINVQEPKCDPDNKRDLMIRSVMGLFRRLVSNLRKLFGIHNIYEIKLTHTRALEILHLMCQVVEGKSPEQMEGSAVPRALFEAIKQGKLEFIEKMLTANALLCATFDENGKSMFQLAIEFRQEKVYSLLYGLRSFMPIDAIQDKFGNTVLHSAASLSPRARLNHIQGAALQMQRELEWFQEVDRTVPPRMREVINHIDGMAARDLFAKTHEELAKEGERSMKETATSCTVVAALIVTIMFTAAFTVPGGNNADTGMPIFLHNKLFKVFVVSDALSLFSSTTSVMIFLGILNSRYAQIDFLQSLPTKMIIGLSALFFSIATMMIAFVSTLFIMLDEKTWTVISITFLASVPVLSFVWMQFPLFVQIFVSTYGAGIFPKSLKEKSSSLLRNYYSISLRREFSN